MFTEPKQLAETLKKIWSLQFGGKPEGRYFISRDKLAALSGRMILRDGFLDDLQDEAMAIGIVLIDIGEGICVLEHSALISYRSVPPSTISALKPQG